MTICEFRQERVVSAAQPIKKGGGFGVGAPTPPDVNTKGRFMLMPLEHIMLAAWWQDVGVYFSRFYGKIERSLTTPYKATAARAVNTERLSIPVPDKED